MPYYRIAGQEFYFSSPFPEIELFKVEGLKAGAEDFSYSLEYSSLVSRTEGWVAGAKRLVEVYDTPGAFLLRVAGCGDFMIPLHGKTIIKVDQQNEPGQLDREVILGPAIVLALAMRGVWNLHASAATFNGNVIVFLGESGQGKSTLAGYLSESPGWALVADDILPVILNGKGVNILPRFPQLKLPLNAQPAAGLPEQLPLKHICVLTHAAADQMPELTGISTGSAVHSLLSHIAGTRMFNTNLLTQHLEFSSQAAQYITAYRLIHPHRRDTLPLVRDLLQKIC